MTEKQEIDVPFVLHLLKKIINELDEIHKMYVEQIEENEELKKRNNRQYERLGQLYDLIEKQDWESLSAIVEELKQADEQLQKEWGTYGGVE